MNFTSELVAWLTTRFGKPISHVGIDLTWANTDPVMTFWQTTNILKVYHGGGRATQCFAKQPEYDLARDHIANTVFLNEGRR